MLVCSKGEIIHDFCTLENVHLFGPFAVGDSLCITVEAMCFGQQPTTISTCLTILEVDPVECSLAQVTNLGVTSKQGSFLGSWDFSPFFDVYQATLVDDEGNVVSESLVQNRTFPAVGLTTGKRYCLTVKGQCPGGGFGVPVTACLEISSCSEVPIYELAPKPQSCSELLLTFDPIPECDKVAFTLLQCDGSDCTQGTTFRSETLSRPFFSVPYPIGSLTSDTTYSLTSHCVCSQSDDGPLGAAVIATTASCACDCRHQYFAPIAVRWTETNMTVEYSSTNTCFTKFNFLLRNQGVEEQSADVFYGASAPRGEDTLTLDDLQPGTDYSITVQAFCGVEGAYDAGPLQFVDFTTISDGGCSGSQVTAAVDSIIDIDLSDRTYQADISWTGDQSAHFYVMVLYDGVVQADIDAEDRRILSISDLPFDKEVLFKIRGICLNGSHTKKYYLYVSPCIEKADHVNVEYDDGEARLSWVNSGALPGSPSQSRWQIEIFQEDAVGQYILFKKFTRPPPIHHIDVVVPHGNYRAFVKFYCSEYEVYGLAAKVDWVQSL